MGSNEDFMETVNTVRKTKTFCSCTDLRELPLCSCTDPRGLPVPGSLIVPSNISIDHLSRFEQYVRDQMFPKETVPSMNMVQRMMLKLRKILYRRKKKIYANNNKYRD